MAWSIPGYSRGEIDRAGRRFVDQSASIAERELALSVINNWRSSHAFPLNTLQVNLRHVARRFDRDATVAQRVKRLPSIRHKLERFPQMALSRMQDLGGARAVLADVDRVDDVVAYYLTTSQMKHKLVRDDDYLSHPRPSGYRGRHLVYRYESDRQTTYNGLRIELQIRSQLQHAWATAVETAGIFTQQALKSSIGEDEWLRFFQLMSTAHALQEGTDPVPDTPTTERTLRRELRRCVRDLDVVTKLNAWGTALQITEDETGLRKGAFFLIELDVEANQLRWQSLKNQTLAAERYDALERATADNPTTDVVLVSVDSVAALRRAYPNYFLDTAAFTESVGQAIR